MVMKKSLIIILLSFVFYSCGVNEQSADHPDISQANKIKFDFKSDFDASGKMTIASTEINDLKSVSTIKNIISYDPFTYVYCASTGSMSFYKDSTLIVTMVFNTLPDLKHIAFNYNGKLIAMSLSGENAKLLESFNN